MRLRLSSSLLLLVSMTMTMMLTTSRVVRAFQFFRKDNADDDAHQSPSGNIINLRLRSAHCAACHRVVSQLHTRLLPKIRSQMQLERDRCVGSRDFHVRELFLFSLSLSLYVSVSISVRHACWCEKIRAPLSLSCLLVFPLADFSLGQLYRSLSDFATKASTYGTYEMLVEDEVEHACKLMSLSDPQKRTRKACDKYVQEHTDDIVETYLQKVTEAKKFIAGFDNVEERKMESSNQEENGYVSEEDVAKDKFERTELFKNMRRHTCEKTCRDPQTSHGKEDEDERKKLDANALNHLDVKDSDLVELENALLTEPLSYEDAREVEETHGFFEIVPKDFETKESIFNSSPIDLLLLISRPNTVGDFQFAQMKILRKVSDAIRAYEEDQDLKEMLLRMVVFDADRFGKEGGIKNSTTLMRATGGYEGPMLLYMTGMKKGECREEIAKAESPNKPGKKKKLARPIPLNSEPGETVVADSAVTYEEILRNIATMSKNKKVRRAIKEIMDDKSVDDKDPKGFHRIQADPSHDMFEKERVIEL